MFESTGQINQALGHSPIKTALNYSDDNVEIN